MRWQIHSSPYAPRFVWLYDHTIDDWVGAEFVPQRPISDAGTQWTWEQATLRVLQDGGRKDDQRRIAREVSALRERARRGPDPQAKRVPQLFTGPILDLDADVPDQLRRGARPGPGNGRAGTVAGHGLQARPGRGRHHLSAYSGMCSVKYG
ncbi:hypothetical protein ACIQKB_36745 [Streptomyces sp. NPDC092046]|uniref:hypothetical protein n=1 Tax=Streptomyces sp. NPDC092046 TaxID=3366009 RepID=UPI0038063A59